MGLTYLNGMNWAGVTREERFFCAHLYGLLQRDKAMALGEFLKKSADHDPATFPWFDETLAARIAAGEVREVGYEVCFYRDLPYRWLKRDGHESKIDKKKVDDEAAELGKRIERFCGEGRGQDAALTRKGFLKRTFDLCLFLDDDLVIVEAKAQQSFKSDQVESFRHDRELIRRVSDTWCLGLNSVQLVVIASSHCPRLKDFSDPSRLESGWITWAQLAGCYADQDNNRDPILLHADSTYGRGGRSARETTSRPMTRNETT